MEDGDTEDTLVGVHGRRVSLPRTAEEATIVGAVIGARPIGESEPRGSGPIAARAQAYRFSLNGEPPIALDVPARVGRAPRLPRVSTGAQPRLISVPSPLREVSATHLELRQDGTSVIVTDTRSTNGTVVTMPVTLAVTLRAGESVVVGPGTVIHLGDGNTIEILPVKRIAFEATRPDARPAT